MCDTAAIDFVFVTNSKSAPGKILVYKSDTHTGALIPISESTYDSGGIDPVAEAVSPNYENLYVVNRDNNDVVHFSIANGGELTAKDTVNTPGLFPMGVAMSPSGNFLYVTDTCFSGTTDIPSAPAPWSSIPSPAAALSVRQSPISRWALRHRCKRAGQWGRGLRD